MNKFIVIVVLTVLAVTACNQSPVEKEFIYVHIPVPVQDTIAEKVNIARIDSLEHKIKLTRDTLNLVRDSLEEKLFVANYKLARIKRYTDIVDKNSSQLKFYKGWIKRALRE